MRHILKPLWRQRMMPLLIVVQVALACAIACNALFLLQQKLVPVLAEDGIGHPQQLLVLWHIAARGEPWEPARLDAVADRLRALPGVSATAVAGSLPMETMAQMTADVTADGSGAKASTAIYVGSHLRRTLDLRLVAGRDFTAAEQATYYRGMGMDQSGPTIITRALAAQLFPDGHALGRIIRLGYRGGVAQRTVVGVVAHLMRNTLGADDRRDIGYSMLFPGIPGQWPVPLFAIRLLPHMRRAAACKAALAVVKQQLGAGLLPGYAPLCVRYAQLRAQMLARPMAAVWLLSGVSLIVVLVALVGIVGLTGYWVQQRTRQIGIHRALGARRIDILRDVLLENLVVMGVGVVLGMAAAGAVNLWLMHHYELLRLPLSYLPWGALLMLGLGQLAVLAPARRAASVSPVVATRTL